MSLNHARSWLKGGRAPENTARAAKNAGGYGKVKARPMPLEENGSIYSSLGTKTSNGGVTSPSAKDVKQLYEYLNNVKYQ